MRFEAVVNIMASTEAIWDAVADPETWPNWTDTISKVNKLSKEPLDVGSKLHITVRIIIPIRMYMTITEFVPGKKVTIKGNILLGNMTRYYMLKPENGHTKAIAGGEVTGPLAPVTCFIGQVISGEILRDLKTKIEG